MSARLARLAKGSNGHRLLANALKIVFHGFTLPVWTPLIRDRSSRSLNSGAVKSPATVICESNTAQCARDWASTRRFMILRTALHVHNEMTTPLLEFSRLPRKCKGVSVRCAVLAKFVFLFALVPDTFTAIRMGRKWPSRASNSSFWRQHVSTCV